jgi:hypothetical protein
MPVDALYCGRKNGQSIEVLGPEAGGETYLAAHGGKIGVRGRADGQLRILVF